MVVAAIAAEGGNRKGKHNFEVIWPNLSKPRFRTLSLLNRRFSATNAVIFLSPIIKVNLKNMLVRLILSKKGNLNRATEFYAVCIFKWIHMLRLSMWA